MNFHDDSGKLQFKKTTYFDESQSLSIFYQPEPIIICRYSNGDIVSFNEAKSAEILKKFKAKPDKYPCPDRK